jgi:hypothetical protein
LTLPVFFAIIPQFQLVRILARAKSVTPNLDAIQAGYEPVK